MGYHATTRRELAKAPRGTLGALLRLAATKRNIAVSKIARDLGCSRPSVYNWFRGGKVSPAYRDRIKVLIASLQDEPKE